MAIAPAQKPDDNAASGGVVSGTSASNAFSGTRVHDDDPTNMEGQYPPGNWGTALFGGQLPMSTGAPGTQGANSGTDDPTNEPGQTKDGLTGISEHDITQTGAPGTAPGGPPTSEGGATTVSYTAPGSAYSGTYQSESQQEDLSGPKDSTQANEYGYASGGPQLPGIAGNEPQPGQGHRYQPGDGHVLRGGYAKGQRTSKPPSR